MSDWPLSDEQESALATAAHDALDRAYAPYSNFKVGAALLCADGTIVAGCNVENASFGLCLCAERGAVATAVAQGRRDFTAICIETISSPPSPPCGMCRQVLAEFSPSMPVMLTNRSGERVRTDVSTLYPSGFDSALLKSGQPS